jgi:translocation and assembly module TamB
VALVIRRREVVIESARFTGTDTNLEVSGKLSLGAATSAFDVRLRGGVNLAILNVFYTSLKASGDATLDASIRGPVSRPEFYGRLELKKASLYLSGVPNGIENASGSILLFRDRATIENLTAETGGGKLTLNGFVGFGEAQPSYRLQATARQVRVRYPEGVSTTLDASIALTGTSSRGLASGVVTILRSGVSPNVDFAGLLASSSRPMITPATQNELLRGMQFDIRIATSANARFETTLTRDVQAEADLRLRGTPYRPVLLGRISINQGEINFLGNRYTINRGEISFLNPVRLEPTVNLVLETRVRGIDATLTFTGPVDRLNVTYRSDPPLQINEIIALLAVGRAPSSDPAVLARQSQSDQSMQQLGASTLVGQALATPVARLQRFFGVSRIKIDPKLTGLGNVPEAQLTLEQQVSKDITLTYVTSLAQEQQQLVRVEWNLNRRWSVVAVREENGLFGIEFQYRRQFK